MNKNWFKMNEMVWDNKSQILVHRSDEAASYFSNGFIRQGRFYFSINIRDIKDAELVVGVMYSNKDGKEPL